MTDDDRTSLRYLSLSLSLSLSLLARVASVRVRSRVITRWMQWFLLPTDTAPECQCIHSPKKHIKECLVRTTMVTACPGLPRRAFGAFPSWLPLTARTSLRASARSRSPVRSRSRALSRTHTHAHTRGLARAHSHTHAHADTGAQLDLYDEGRRRKLEKSGAPI